MKPSEIYAQPVLETDPWWYAPGMVEDLYRDLPFHELDVGAAQDSGTARLTFETRLWCEPERGRTAHVYSASFDSVCFAVLLAGGRGGNDTVRTLVTDSKTYQAAAQHLLSFHTALTDIPRVLDPDRDTPLLGEFYTQKIVRQKDGLALVDAGEHSEAGVQVLDLAALDRAVRTAVPADRRDRQGETWFTDDAKRAALAQAALACVPEGIEAVTVDALHDESDDGPKQTWIAIAIRDPHGEVLTVGQDLSLLVSIGPHSLSLKGARRVTDPDLLRRLRFDGQPHALDDAVEA